MPDVSAVPLDLAGGFNFGTILTAGDNPAVGFVLIGGGLALCFIGYFLYRLMLALAVAAVGGVAAWFLAPNLDVEGTALWATAGAAAVIGFLVGWFLYSLGIFLVGGASGLSLGALLWFLASGFSPDIGALASLSVEDEELLYAAAGMVIPALTFGILAVRWERTVITFIAVLIGALLLALGFRYAGLPENVGNFGAAAASLAMALGLLVNLRPRSDRRRAAMAKS